MSLAPEIAAFGDASHLEGETGLAIDGGGFGAFPGSVWLFANEDLSGAADQLTVNGPWNDIRIEGIDIPAAPNNIPGTVYVAVQREDLAWSNAFSFTLNDSGGQVIVGQAQETDTALAADRAKAFAVGLATETETTFAVTWSKRRAVGQALEIDTAPRLVMVSDFTFGITGPGVSESWSADITGTPITGSGVLRNAA